MSIEKITTEGLILKSYINGEHDLIFKIFTFQFGVIFVIAKSIRKINSKLRMKMQINHYVNITIVKGRENYRLTGVEEINIFNYKNLFIISECLNRFLPNEKTHKNLFIRLKDISLETNLSINDFRILIYFIVLVETGYADIKVLGVKDLEEYNNFSVKNLETYFILNQKEIKNHLRKVLYESML